MFSKHVYPIRTHAPRINSSLPHRRIVVVVVLCAERLNHTAWKTSKCDSWLQTDKESMTHSHLIYLTHVNGISIVHTNIHERHLKRKHSPVRSLTHTVDISDELPLNWHGIHVRGGEKRPESREVKHAHIQSSTYEYQYYSSDREWLVQQWEVRCVANNRLSIIKERICDSKSARNVKCDTALTRCFIHIWYDESARPNEFIVNRMFKRMRRHRIVTILSSSLLY